MRLYKNKYNTRSNRLSGWDYASAAHYFVTLCTRNRICYFGDIISLQGFQSSVDLSPIGNIAHQYWEDIPKHFENIDIDEFIIMPNHVHGIIIINEPTVETRHAVSLPQTFGKPIPNSLPTIIRSYKSVVTKWCNENNNPFSWQRNYHEHIIRNENELNRIREYISNNPNKWKTDENFI